MKFTILTIFKFSGIKYLHTWAAITTTNIHPQALFISQTRLSVPIKQ